MSYTTEAQETTPLTDIFSTQEEPNTRIEKMISGETTSKRKMKEH